PPTSTLSLHDALPISKLQVPVALPTAWMSRPARIRADLRAGAATGFFASFDWRLRIGELGLDEDELRALAAQRNPVVQAEGRWQDRKSTRLNSSHLGI